MNEQDLAQQNLIYKVQTGSLLYGTHTEKSDKDFVGLFLPSEDYVIGRKHCDQVILSEKVSKTTRNQVGDIDFTVYNIIKFIDLAVGNNPNIIELFYIPKQNILFDSAYSQMLLDRKDWFLSKKAYHTFKGYAYAQRQKLMVKRENMTGRKELAFEFGYDTKFASHLIRLLLEGLQILTEHRLEFPLPQNNLIRDIKIGKYELSWVMEKADYYEKLIDEAYIKSNLQYSANEEKINSLQINILKEFWRHK